MTCCVTSAARAPLAWPPMPSTTTSNAACSATAAETLSWFSSRPPRRLISAYSTRKKNSVLLLDLILLYITPQQTRVVSAPALTTITSMTGFARREVSGPWGTLVCELRSVNHRFLEAGFRLPDELRQAESELRQRLAKEVKRGKVDCSMSYRRLQGADNALEVDAQALERLTARVREVSKLLPDHSVNVLDILRWPGVLRDDTNVGDDLLVTARTLFDGTVEDLVAARAREGLRLRELLEQRCGALEV